jgi:outer membrane immunogenic protein
VTDQLLVFATGGLAYGHVTAQTTVSETVASMEAASGSLGSVFQHLAAAQARRQAHTRKRASEGLSEQYAITRNWSLKTEYLHWDLGRADYTLTPLSVQTLSTLGLGVGTVATSTTGTTASARFSGDFVRASVNYKFD